MFVTTFIAKYAYKYVIACASYVVHVAMYFFIPLFNMIIIKISSNVWLQQKHVPSINNFVAHSKSLFKIWFTINSPIEKMIGILTSGTRLMHSMEINTIVLHL